MMPSQMIYSFPRHIAEMAEFKEISKACDYLLNRAADDLEMLKKNLYIETMSEEGCEVHERILKLTPIPGASVSDRIRRIKGHYASDLPYTQNKLKAVLDAMCDSSNGYALSVDMDAMTVTVYIRLNSKFLMNDIAEILEKMVPANMTSVKVVIQYNIYGRFKGLTYKQLSQYTYLQLREDKSFEDNSPMYCELGNYKYEGLKKYTYMQIAKGDME